MRPEDFVHLHVHSHYSALDGCVTVDGLIGKARALGMRALALTDHGTLSGAIEFYRKARRGDPPLKPIIGFEAYMSEGSRLERTVDDRPAHIYHATLLAKDLEGYRNLVKLSSAGHVEGFYRKPRIDMEIFGRHSRGIIVLSGCLSGRIPRLLLYDHARAAEEAAGLFREIVGPDNFFIELMRNGLAEQDKVTPRLVDLARRNHIPLVATNDVHYLEREDSIVQEVLVCIQRGQMLRDENRQRMGTDQFYFRSGAEMMELFAELPEAAENTARIAECCNLELEFGRYHIPAFTTDSGESPAVMLRRLCLDGVRKRYGFSESDLSAAGSAAERVLRRLDSELAVIEEMGFASYFLIVWDFIRFARENGIPVGPGRGSAAGSVVAYALGITQLDPLKYDLLFERFLNSSRISMPDIDIDFCVRGREKVVNYVREKYGHDNVCQIVTFGTLAAKAALRDSGRVLDIDLPTVDAVAKKIPAVKPPGETRSLLEVAVGTDPDLKAMAAEEPRIREWFDISLKIEGLNRHPSTHAAGVVIAPRPLTEFVPLCRVKDEINTQFQMSDLDAIGLLKMDFLGLKNLTVIDKALGLIERQRGVRVDLETIPLDDAATYALLQSGRAKGIFQLESSEGMSNLLVKLRPDCFEDLIALLALYRPGPLGSGMVDLYVERKHGRQKVDMLHPSLSEVLKETYGVIVYQEQVMRIANVMAGFSLNEADKLRKVMSKKKPAEMEKFRDKFIQGSKAQGIDPESAGDVFDKIEYFAGYGFNKSHSAAYAMITYRTAYLKANYLLEYMCALMSCDAANTDKIAEYVEECERFGLRVLGPDYNTSQPDFSISGEVRGEAIRFGLNAIKGLGEKAAETIVKVRDKQGGFSSVAEMLEKIDLKTLNKLSLETLTKAGAFDSTGISRASYFNAADQLLAFASSEQIDRRRGQASLFGAGPAGGREGPAIPLLNEWDDAFKLACEKEALGFILSANPLKQYAPILKRITPNGPDDLRSAAEGGRAVIGGAIEQVRVTAARKGRNAGKRITLFKVRTLAGRVACVLFPEDSEKLGHMIQEDRIYAFAGSLDSRREEPSLIVSEILTLDDMLRQRFSAFVVRLGSCERVREEVLGRIGEACRRHPGGFDLLLHFEGPDRRGITVQAGPQYRVEPSLESLLELEAAAGPENVEIR